MKNIKVIKKVSLHSTAGMFLKKVRKKPQMNLNCKKCAITKSIFSSFFQETMMKAAKPPRNLARPPRSSWVRIFFEVTFMFSPVCHLMILLWISKNLTKNEQIMIKHFFVSVGSFPANSSYIKSFFCNECISKVIFLPWIDSLTAYVCMYVRIYLLLNRWTNQKMIL